MIALRIQQRTGESLSSQLARQIRHAIHSGLMTPGQALPSVRELAGKLHIHALTIAKAYAALEQQGLVATQWGKGTFVTPGKDSLDRKSREYLRTLVAKFIQETLPLVKDQRQLRSLFEQELKAHPG